MLLVAALFDLKADGYGCDNNSEEDRLLIYTASNAMYSHMNISCMLVQLMMKKNQHTFGQTQQKNSYGAVIPTRSDWWYEWLFPLSVPQNRSTLIILSISLSISLLDQSVGT